jgi:hypothetical protein
LATAARTAKSSFRAVTKDDLNQAKQDIAAAVTRLDSRLSQDEVNGKGWRKYTQLDKLLQQLALPAGPDVAVLTTIYEKFAAGHEGLEMVWFVDVRQALQKYIETAGVIDNAQADKKYQQVLDRLATDLEAYAAAPTVDQAYSIGKTLAWLENLHQSPELVKAVRASLLRPNLYFHVRDGVVGAGIDEPVDDVMPVHDCILGTDIEGTARTIGQTKASLFPDADVAAIDITLLAMNRSENVGRNGPVCIFNTSCTGLSACKRIWMDADGLSSHPAAANAETHSTINSISAKNNMIERIAWKRAGKQQGEAEAIASQHAQWRVSERVDKKSAETVNEANANYQKKVRGPLSDRKVFPQLLRFSTTAEALHMLGVQASADQVAAPGEPPAIVHTDADMSLRIHESSANNLAGSVLSGMILHEATLQATLRDMLGKVPEKLKPDPDQEPWTIAFARQQPISVSFADNGFTVTIRGREYFKGDKGYPGMNVTAKYKFVEQNGVFKAVRQGDLQIFPPGFVPRGGRQISVRQQVIRTLLERRLGKVFEPEMVAKGFTPSGKWAAVGKLQPVELTAQNGWLTIGWRRVASDKAVATR